jgi:hypothetical protein
VYVERRKDGAMRSVNRCTQAVSLRERTYLVVEELQMNSVTNLGSPEGAGTYAASSSDTRHFSIEKTAGCKRFRTAAFRTCGVIARVGKFDCVDVATE